jgi:shikimate dehydrogenase
MSEVALKAGVIGWPIDHSLSPHLHGFWLDQYAIDGEYLPFAVEPNNLESFLRGLAENGRRGTNVTLPHKQATLEIVDHVDDNARRIGAVNTVVVQDDGSLHGSNTDAFGFLENLKNQVPNWQASAGPAVVLGAGGAARAILVALQESGVPEIKLLNRTKSRSQELAAELGGIIEVYDWEGRADVISDAATLVNTTSLGMKGQSPLEINLAKLPETALVNDIVYTPLETGLLKNAKQRGNPAVDGLGMLLHQARPGFAAWFGMEPEVTDALRDHVLKAMGS